MRLHVFAFHAHWNEQDLLEGAELTCPTAASEVGQYNQALVGRMLQMVRQASNVESQTRLVTLSLTSKLITNFIMCPKTYDEELGTDRQGCLITPDHFEVLKEIRDSVISQLSRVYSETTWGDKTAQAEFLDLFEDEQRQPKPVKVPLLMSQACMLLVPTSTDNAKVDFEWRLPGNTKERTRKAIQIYLLFRKFYLDVVQQKETLLPLRQPTVSVSLRDSLDLNNSDLIACNVISKARTGQTLQVRRFLMVDRWRLVLMEPDNTKPGWGIVRFVADLNNVFVVSQPYHTRALQIAITQRSTMYVDWLAVF